MRITVEKALNIIQQWRPGWHVHITTTLEALFGNPPTARFDISCRKYSEYEKNGREDCIFGDGPTLRAALEAVHKKLEPQIGQLDLANKEIEELAKNASEENNVS